ncbi:cupin-like domain-containing protein [Burkholderia gladioli]|uniref:cupin-like domain-containing protein n=1 Tax=Burkholderia gladioli TaxID=28095 RepID=UPI00163E0BA5|nr:cupin-like domain-containing protein [Burkholderia gladioli]
MAITKCGELSEQAFISRYLTTNQPVIVVGEMDTWGIYQEPALQYFATKCGDEQVQVYDNLFGLIDVCSLRAYLLASKESQDAGSLPGYVRWYAQFRDVDFVWSDPAFSMIEREWAHPSFLPKSSYCLPPSRKGQEIDVTRDAFPYKGIFISSAGCRTRLHRDPIGTQAIICQLQGTKRVTLYSPDAASKLECDGAFFDPMNPDKQMFPMGEHARPEGEIVLQPGEILFIPDGWYHDVLTLTASVSITWNFVHSARTQGFINGLQGQLTAPEASMVRYFFKGVDAGHLDEMETGLRRALYRANVLSDTLQKGSTEGTT